MVGVPAQADDSDLAIHEQPPTQVLTLRDGRRLAYTVLGDPEGMPIIQQQFKEVGIGMDIVSAEAIEITRRRNAGDFDLVQVGGGIFRQDPNVSGKYMETINWVPVGGNYGHYTNTRLDELFPKGRSTADLNQRKQIYTEAATIMNDELPWIYLWSPNSIFAVSKRLTGFKPPSYATHNMWNADEWTVAG